MNKYPVIHIIFKDAKTNSWKETYERFEAKSERESGFGRYDVVIIDRETPRAMIMEFKVSEEEDLAKDALKALEQIENKKYDADLKDRGINNIVKAGIALKGKMCSCRVV
ncbi:MAG: hypothetical protein PWP45_1870 [Tepidanaerobacteraceae bacterium]|nr:hypothetical protein [Tepidanaerobacteraceae bacterium]